MPLQVATSSPTPVFQVLLLILTLTLIMSIPILILRVSKNTNREDFKEIIRYHWDRLSFDPCTTESRTWLGINFYCQSWEYLLNQVLGENGYNFDW